MTTTLFISDLHLCASRPRIKQLFFDFLQSAARKADQLYILGDFFEYWAGDDDIEDPFNRSIVSALAALTSSGVAVYLMHGNRDFLIGEAFCQASGARLLSDPSLIELNGARTLLMHGDTLCTDDVEYQNFRKQVRDPRWQRQFLSQPLEQRKAIIADLRRRSETEKQMKSIDIMDVTPASVEAALREHIYPRLIHGHTHRPALHHHQVDGKECERWVLTDWYQHGGYLRCDANGLKAIRIP
ncbi:MAG: UDP-2,3-diacylglucosamine diphosphatase [Pseudomonadota bacterium]|nr:UDP-2,3-diacylglucosamine diphosphatase [Pseudomonadota bacterium]